MRSPDRKAGAFRRRAFGPTVNAENLHCGRHRRLALEFRLRGSLFRAMTARRFGDHMQAANDNASRGRSNPLPYGVPPRGMSRTESAAYLGVSPTLFDLLVKDGRAPQPKLINTRTVWDRLRLDEAFDALDERQAANPWDEAYLGGRR